MANLETLQFLLNDSQIDDIIKQYVEIKVDRMDLSLIHI